MARGLIFHTRGDVFVHVVHHALLDERGVKLLKKRRVARDAPRLQIGGLRLHVLVRISHRATHRARGVPHFEARVPQRVENLFHHRIQARIELLRLVRMQKHDVHIAEKIHLPAAITADRHERDPRRLAEHRHALQRGVEQMPQHDVQQAGPLRANLPSPAAGPMLQFDPVVLDLEEFFVEREQLLRVQRTLGTELLLGVGEHFFTMSEHGFGGRIKAREDARSRPAGDSISGPAGRGRHLAFARSSHNFRVSGVSSVGSVTAISA